MPTNINSTVKFNNLLLLYNIHNIPVLNSPKCDDTLNPKLDKFKLFNKTTISEITHKTLLTTQFTVTQIKSIASAHNLGFTKCKKTVMIQQLYIHLFFEQFILKIQSWTRKRLLRQFNLLHGPAFIKRNLCVNREDFLTFDSIQTINPYESISFQEGSDKNNIYIFTIVSFIELIQQQTRNKIVHFDKILNPYTRHQIDVDIIKRALTIYKIGTTMYNIKYPQAPTLINNTTSLSSIVNFKAIELFQKLEHYSDIHWFISLGKTYLKGFLLELINIWEYRSELSIQAQISLFPPCGNPFKNIRINSIFRRSQSLLEIQNNVLDILIQFISAETTHADDQKTLHLYVLGALTIYSRSAANALPWLYLSIAT
jgi:hypothetical protein